MRRIATLLTLLLGASVQAQEKKVITLPYDGPDFFSHILFAKGLTPIASFEEAIKQPEETIIIVWGEVNGRDVQHFFREQEQRFRKSGGHLLVATDYPLRAADYAVFGGPVSVHPDRAFGGHSLCPWVSYDSTTEEGKVASEHPLFHLLKNRIATNRPSTLMEGELIGLQGLAVLPRGKFFGGGFGVRRSFYIAASPKGTVPLGRTAVIAGHGMFTNGMMLQPDTDNFAFAINAIEWLREGPNATKRTHALFVVDGQVITRFDRDLTPPMPPIPMPTVEMVNRLLRGLEDEGFFHWMFQNLLGDRYRYVAPFLIGVVTCLTLLYGAKKFMDGRTMNDTAAPRMVGGAMPTQSTETRDSQRQKALYRQQDASSEAMLLARHWLAVEFGISSDQCIAGALAIQVSGFFWTRGSLQRQVDLLVQVACAAPPNEMSRSEFASLVRSLTRLSRAHRAGRLTLLLPQKEVT